MNRHTFLSILFAVFHEGEIIVYKLTDEIFSLVTSVIFFVIFLYHAVKALRSMKKACQ